MPLYSTACPLPINRKIFRHRGSSSPIPQSGLSLWLKADAGISFFSFDYKSRIVLSGSVSGTFNATSVPTYDFYYGIPSNYSLSNGTSTINWSENEGGSFLIQTASITLQGNTVYAGYISSDGINWGTNGNWITPPYISGLTNDYSNGNGQYEFTENNPYDGSPTLIPADGIFYTIQGSSGNWQLWYLNNNTEEYFQIASNSNALPNGTWTMIVSGIGTAIGTGSAYATNPTPPTTTSSITSNITTNNIASWADQSGNGRNASQATGIVPIYSLIGGKSFITFQSNAALLISSSIWNGVQFVGTIITVARFEPSASASILLLQEGPEGNLTFARKLDGTNAFSITTDDIDVVTSLSLANDNTNYLLGATISQSLTATLYLNGSSVGSGGITNNTGYTYGAYIGGGDGSSNIAEMVIYNRVLTTQERQQVETYLNTKYAIY